MTTNNEIRLRRDMKVFKSVNLRQRKQASLDTREHIKDMANSYNANRLPGEPLIAVTEIAEQLERKC